MRNFGIQPRERNHGKQGKHQRGLQFVPNVFGLSDRDTPTVILYKATVAEYDLFWDATFNKENIGPPVS